jgi:hypothetical protein
LVKGNFDVIKIQGTKIKKKELFLIYKTAGASASADLVTLVAVIRKCLRPLSRLLPAERLLVSLLVLTKIRTQTEPERIPQLGVFQRSGKG